MGELDRRVRKGRGAVTNRPGRYEAEDREAFDDGWSLAERSALRTTVGVDASRSVLTFNQSPDVPFDRSINPYRGCEHGCVYCFARPTHAWLGLSPGQDFESRLFYKPEAAALLRTALAKPGYACAPIALGANTDGYQPVERGLRVTRAIVEVLAECRHPVTVITKSALVERDIDLLGPMAAQGLCQVAVSVTTLDRGLSRRMEPRAAAPHRRLRTIEALAAAGIPVTVLAAPMIPGLNDAELERILEAARSAGASEARYILLRLPLELAALWREWLETHYPLAAERVLALGRSTRAGRDYDARFGIRMRGTGPVADLIAQRFAGARRRLGFPDVPPLATDRFRPPPPAGQLTLDL